MAGFVLQDIAPPSSRATSIFQRETRSHVQTPCEPDDHVMAIIAATVQTTANNDRQTSNVGKPRNLQQILTFGINFGGSLVTKLPIFILFFLFHYKFTELKVEAIVSNESGRCRLDNKIASRRDTLLLRAFHWLSNDTSVRLFARLRDVYLIQSQVPILHARTTFASRNISNTNDISKRISQETRKIARASVQLLQLTVPSCSLRK